MHTHGYSFCFPYMSGCWLLSSSQQATTLKGLGVALDRILWQSWLHSFSCPIVRSWQLSLHPSQLHHYTIVYLMSHTPGSGSMMLMYFTLVSLVTLCWECLPSLLCSFSSYRILFFFFVVTGSRPNLTDKHYLGSTRSSHSWMHTMLPIRRILDTWLDCSSYNTLWFVTHSCI